MIGRSIGMIARLREMANVVLDFYLYGETSYEADEFHFPAQINLADEYVDTRLFTEESFIARACFNGTDGVKQR
jgi:hypothetical protein